jgi:hypothetical protein
MSRVPLHIVTGLLVLLGSMLGCQRAFAADDNRPAEGSLLSVCPGIEGFLERLPDGSFSQPWQRRYAALVFDVAPKSRDAGVVKVYWKPSRLDSKSQMLSLKGRTFTPFAYTTETVLVLVCNAKFGDGSNSTNTSITITPGDENLTHKQKLAPLWRPRPADLSTGYMSCQVQPTTLLPK